MKVFKTSTMLLIFVYLIWLYKCSEYILNNKLKLINNIFIFLLGYEDDLAKIQSPSRAKRTDSWNQSSFEMHSQRQTSPKIIENMVTETHLDKCHYACEHTKLSRPRITNNTPNNRTFNQEKVFKIRKTNSEKSIRNKQLIIKMLTVVVIEYFICWSPLYIVNTIALYSPEFLYNHVSGSAISCIHLLAYCSSCCNPITYCFMSAIFRQAFWSTIKCSCCTIRKRPSDSSYRNNY